MLRRKAAFVLTAVMTVVFMFLRWFSDELSTITVGPAKASDLVLVSCIVTVGIILALCISKKATVQSMNVGAAGAMNGWLCTFCGAILAMSMALDTFCWAKYGQVPPPNTYILNNVDLITLIASLICGILGGVFLVMQGFCWMSRSENHKSARGWLSLAPVLWMWFRLARYEISYASTIDISESFFDFAILIFASLFFLQLARTVSNIGPAPKNGLLICALCTAFIALSGAPVTIAELAQGQPIGSLLGAIVDVVIGIFALEIGFIQAFGKTADESITAEDTLAWTTPERDMPPLEPAFEIDAKLPKMDEDVIVITNDSPAKEEAPATKANEPAAKESAVKPVTEEALTIDDILTEIDSIE